MATAAPKAWQRMDRTTTIIFDDKDVQITDTAFSRAKTEGMATKDVVGNQSGAPADDSMGRREKLAPRSAHPVSAKAMGFALTGGMQERAVRAEKIRVAGTCTEVKGGCERSEAYTNHGTNGSRCACRRQQRNRAPVGIRRSAGA